MQIGVQYYRPPFPNERYWKDDLKNIRAAGFNTLQLWVLWSWVESTPGRYDFSDYDRLVELANKTGLKVVLSAIAEVQPLWIHREIPGSEMVNHLGQKVVSNNRVECHFGITPGGCFDHPLVWERMQAFLRATAGHYKDAPNLFGWDAWNELRWNVHAQGLVCFCEHTLKNFREWLKNRHGGLDGLNRAWQRRYAVWEDVFPGRAPSRPFTETMAFQHFLTERANEHARKRYEAIKAVDSVRPVTMHGGAPSPYYCGEDFEDQIITPLDRGNDWNMVACLDGIGCSSFPKWERHDLADFTARMNIIRSAAGKKRLWLSELQGGRAARGFSQQLPVFAVEQQHWLWNGIATGAEAILFWCWKDEVFTTEAGGFGISGFDGYAEERLAAFKATGKILEKHKNVWDKYRPSRPDIGIFFSPQSAYLHWCNNKQNKTYLDALLGYGKALVRSNIAFEMIEEEHLDELKRLKVLFMPRALVTDKKTEDKLLAYVSGGGTLVVESECGAFDSRGIYRYPADRFLSRLGVQEAGRRTITGDLIQFSAAAGKRRFALTGSQWVTPWLFDRGQVWAKYGREILAGEITVGKGRVVLLGTYLGEAYFKKRIRGFENFLEMICKHSGFCREAEAVDGRQGEVYLRAGESGGKRIFFVFCESKCITVAVNIAKEILQSQTLTDLISGKTAKGIKNKNGALSFKFKVPRERMLALMELV